MKEPAPMPTAWCAARRTEIQACVDAPSIFLSWPQARTYLIELLAQLKQADYETSDLHVELKDKPFIEFRLVELEAENKALNAAVVARDQWADQLTEQYGELIKLLATKFNFTLD